MCLNEHTMKRTLNILLILISTLSYSQNSSEFDVFKKIIDHEIGKGTLGIYIQCEKPKTFFDYKDFKEQTGLEVPENILKEIEINGTKRSNGIWKSEILSGLSYGSDSIKSKKCLTTNNAERLFKKTKLRQTILIISEPIFDNNYENCVVSVTHRKFIGSAYGHSYFLKKVYGLWTVIVIYGIWMT
ncbi:hypothetical protein SAMN03097699_1820 [Flavobacteriaceae bacterium MAR_2010_188]|nr:hypothetical protein SAMN03097699_1820 [Flavobacteriaceae bacterium MAR_2010_188]